jgi:2-amino-4-hydroxy-6-hydroxymethyldihydropteridine diphosphokinase
MSHNSVHRNSVYIALGSNLNKPQQQVRAAFDALSRLDGAQLIKRSSLYLSQPMGPQDQDMYVNAVAEINTCSSAIELLDQLQQIESNQGRIRKKQQWGPRTLDLDLLLFKQQVINSERLTVPHYDLQSRSFVLMPLFEIAPQLILPNQRSIADLVKIVGSQGITKL